MLSPGLAAEEVDWKGESARHHTEASASSLRGFRDPDSVQVSAHAVAGETWTSEGLTPFGTEATAAATSLGKLRSPPAHPKSHAIRKAFTGLWQTWFFWQTERQTAHLLKNKQKRMKGKKPWHVTMWESVPQSSFPLKGKRSRIKRERWGGRERGGSRVLFEKNLMENKRNDHCVELSIKF